MFLEWPGYGQKGCTALAVSGTEDTAEQRMAVFADGRLKNLCLERFEHLKILLAIGMHTYRTTQRNN
jgi:hypothetical protein